MEDQEGYLKWVLEKLRKRLEEVEISLEEGVREIEQMHKYYWENYTEMDEYGYENFDNQQALFHQAGTNQNRLKQKQKLLKMLQSPYFGRVDFLYEGEEEAEHYYIGIGNFSENPNSIPLILDWRAPISSLFYDYEKGMASFMAPAGEIEGEIQAKWQYKIKNGKLLYAFESDVKIDDDILMNELGMNGDVRLKNIVRTIQKEQNQIIRNTKDPILVVQGVAGSGKTSIALHRIAYLLYHDRKNLSADHILILSPNRIFSDYISQILPELGEENIQEMSFDSFAYKELREYVSDCEERYDAIEQLLKRKEEFWMKKGEEDVLSKDDAIAHEHGFSDCRSWKQSSDFIRQIYRYILELEDELMNFQNVDFKKIHKTKQEIRRLFYEKFPETPLLSRMQMVMDYVVDESETLENRNYDDMELMLIQDKMMRMYETLDLYVIYSRFLMSLGLNDLEHVPYEKRKLSYEDVYPMLYMKYQLKKISSHRPIKYLVIDEMQDYSYLQYQILKQLFNCKMTILGDRAQTMEENAHDVMQFLPQIFGKNIRMISINKSYRNTIEIAQYAQKLFGECKEMEFLERHGKHPEEAFFSGWKEALEEVNCHLRSEKEFEITAILCISEREAQKAYEILKELEKGEESAKRLYYLDRDSKEFQKGVVVTTFYLAKGLEFDQVFFVYEDWQNDPIHKQAKYIGATRALHELYFYQIKRI